MTEENSSFDSLGETKGNAEHELSAPAQTTKSGSKGIPALAGIALVIALLGGGYYMMTSSADETPMALTNMDADLAATDTAAIALGTGTGMSSYEETFDAAEVDIAPAEDIFASNDALASAIEDGNLPTVEAQSATNAWIDSNTPEMVTTDAQLIEPAPEEFALIQPPESPAIIAEIPTAPETPETMNAPSDAELALIENIGVLDDMTQTEHKGLSLSETAAAAPKPAALPIKKAIVRPRPKKYLIVKKNRGAGDMNSRLTAARVALIQNRNTAALDIFNELQTQYPRDTRITMGRAVSLQRLGMHDDALAAYEQVLIHTPKNLEALTNMLGLIKAQNPELALTKLQELRIAYPSNSDITAQLGIAYGGAGNYASAMKYLNIAEALQPNNAYITYNKAIVYDHMGEGTRAATLYRQIVRQAADGNLNQPLPIEAIRNRLAVLR